MLSRLLPFAERLRELPGSGGLLKFGGDLLDVWGLRRHRPAPLGARCFADARDVADEIPNDFVGQQCAPSRHSKRPPVRNREVDICRLSSKLEDPFAQCRPHAPTGVRRMTSDAVEL